MTTSMDHCEMAEPCCITLTLEKLKEREADQLQIADIAVRKVYAKRIRSALGRLNVEKYERKSFADGLLSGRISLDSIAKNKTGEWEDFVSNVFTEYQDLNDTAFLMFNIPTASAQMTYDLDKAARHKQLCHFYEIITHHTDQNKNPREIHIVKDYSNMKDWIETFMETTARASKRVTLVFNGHGSDSGELAMANDTVSNSTLLSDVYEARAKYLDESSGSVLPQKVTVVFAQCYGHVHSQDVSQKSIIEVVCLTNECSPTTQYVFKLNPTNTAIQDSLHLDLANFARSEAHRSASVSSSDTPLPSPDDVKDGSPGATALVEQSCSDISHVDMTPIACMAFRNDNTLESCDSIDSWLQSFKSLQMNVTQNEPINQMSTSNAIMKTALQMALPSFNVLQYDTQGESKKQPDVKMETSSKKKTMLTSALQFVNDIFTDHSLTPPTSSQASPAKCSIASGLLDVTDLADLRLSEEARSSLSTARSTPCGEGAKPKTVHSCLPSSSSETTTKQPRSSTKKFTFGFKKSKKSDKTSVGLSQLAGGALGLANLPLTGHSNGKSSDRNE